MNISFLRPGISATLVFSLLLMTALTQARNESYTINDILKFKEEPAGVVFEIVTGKNDGLEWALPLVKKHIDKLKSRYPDIDVAIVTHGREQFALQKQKKSDNKKVHSLTQQLVSEGIPLHVCETHAEWRGVTAEDFPDYVNVSSAGPAQINDYISVGYLLVVIKRPE